MSLAKTVYIVATPIGNLGDLSSRAIEVLKSVNLIAAEDTRHSKRLMEMFGINTPLVSLHEHNEQDKGRALLERVKQGQSLAVISDAGTPLISDPGIHIVRIAYQMGLKVVPIPGACALITALSASGLPTDRFCFEGFLPAKDVAREKVLQNLAQEPRSIVFYEAPHRILETITAMYKVFQDREATIARELTKQFEQIRTGTLAQLLQEVQDKQILDKGEFVIIVAGAKEAKVEDHALSEMLKVLLTELSVKQASSLAAKLTKRSKKEVYKQALLLSEKESCSKEL